MDKKVNVHEGHRARMRKRFRETGFEGFNEHEVIEMLLFYACPRKDTNALAHTLIDRFGSIAGIMDADYEELVKIKGITENAATLFKMIPKFLPLYYNSKSEERSFSNSDELKKMFSTYFVGLKHEEFRLACFDNNFRMISNILISSGAPSSTAINIRKIIEEALRTKAAFVAVAHNHPHGDSLASNEDINATRQINAAMQLISVELIDHVIVSETHTVSMRQLGYSNLFS
ncbi:MAG: RadC family protein [Oscillospiraceae bacterium]|nr:RadC family protein [Oscillospiraceae bacterium]